MISPKFVKNRLRTLILSVYTATEIILESANRFLSHMATQISGWKGGWGQLGSSIWILLHVGDIRMYFMIRTPFCWKPDLKLTSVHRSTILLKTCLWNQPEFNVEKMLSFGRWKQVQFALGWQPNQISTWNL